MNIYVGNLSYTTTGNELRSAFEQFGTVDEARVASDRDSGRSRGFGFVEMPDGAEAKTAISQLHGTDLNGRDITVNEARPREERPRSGGYSSGRGRY